MTIEEMVRIIRYYSESSLMRELIKLLDDNNYIQATKVIQDYFKCDEETAKNVCMEFKTKFCDRLGQIGPSEEDLLAAQEAYNNRVAQELLNKPKCPTCGSTNIKKISGTERAISVLGLGIFSNKINKSYKCENCKCTW